MCVPGDAFSQTGSGDAGPFYATEHGRTYATVFKSMPADKSFGRIVYSMFVPLPADVKVNYNEITYHTRAADPASARRTFATPNVLARCGPATTTSIAAPAAASIPSTT